MTALNGNLTAKGLVAALSGPVTLDPAARARMTAGVADTDALRTKWRWLADSEPPADPHALVRAFVLGHCAGVGRPLAWDLVKALIIARCSVLAAGYSGVSPAFVDGMLALLDDAPFDVPSQGALGAAGSPPLAHVLAHACGYLGGLARVRPTEKEALAWLNGDTFTAALGAVAVVRAQHLVAVAIDACALSFEAARADLHCIDPRVLDARRQPGAIAVAASLRERLAGSTLCGAGRKPDPFSLRCAPIVLGAVADTVDYAEEAIDRELSAVQDNPLLFDGQPIEAGNFHGAPAALAMDALKTALTQLASISERRTFRLTYGQLSGLPSFLVHGTGLNSGLMLAQYTAASLVSEMKGLSHPASVDSIPVVQHREDHAPNGPVAARMALRVLDCLTDVLSIELLCAAQAVDLRLEADGHPAPHTAALHANIRAVSPRWVDDRVLRHDLIALRSFVDAQAAS